MTCHQLPPSSISTTSKNKIAPTLLIREKKIAITSCLMAGKTQIQYEALWNDFSSIMLATEGKQFWWGDLCIESCSDRKLFHTTGKKLWFWQRTLHMNSISRKVILGTVSGKNPLSKFTFSFLLCALEMQNVVEWSLMEFNAELGTTQTELIIGRCPNVLWNITKVTPYENSYCIKVKQYSLT